MNRGSNGAAWRRIGLGVLVSGLLAACGTVPYTQRNQPMAISNAEEAELGLVLMAKAGYDPRTAIDFWRRLLSSGKGGKTSEILSSHPSGEERLHRLEEIMPIAVEYYRKAGPAPRRLEDESAKPPDVTPEEILRRLQEPEPLD